MSKQDLALTYILIVECPHADGSLLVKEKFVVNSPSFVPLLRS